MPWRRRRRRRRRDRGRGPLLAKLPVDEDIKPHDGYPLHHPVTFEATVTHNMTDDDATPTETSQPCPVDARFVTRSESWIERSSQSRRSVSLMRGRSVTRSKSWIVRSGQSRNPFELTQGMESDHWRNNFLTLMSKMIKMKNLKEIAPYILELRLLDRHAGHLVPLPHEQRPMTPTSTDSSMRHVEPRM